ncbi:hypothetical protein Dimus_030529 [Dionaea muscipula]
MATKGDLWDDSALINAFDQAMSKYKRMHIQGYKEDSAADGEVKNSNDDSSTVIVGSAVKESHMETENERNLASDLVAEMGQEEYSVNGLGNETTVSEALDDFYQGWNGNPTNAEDYYELSRQYYKLEEQRQTILGKLQQFGDWNYSCPFEGSGSGLLGDGVSSLHAHQSSISQASHHNALVSCCPYVCECSIAPCSSIPCTFAGPCACPPCIDRAVAVGVGRQSAIEDADIVKTAMGVVQRAITTVKDQPSGEKAEHEDYCVIKPDTSGETDLTVVLNAWFSAGFHTGKYLAEQSLAKKQHG